MAIAPLSDASVADESRRENTKREVIPDVTELNMVNLYYVMSFIWGYRPGWLIVQRQRAGVAAFLARF
jgi:hypothetical protein